MQLLSIRVAFFLYLEAISRAALIVLAVLSLLVGRSANVIDFCAIAGLIPHNIIDVPINDNTFASSINLCIISSL